MLPVDLHKHGGLLLVITCKDGESYFVGDNVEVIVLGTGTQTRVGIIAPRCTRITRSELINRSLSPTVTISEAIRQNQHGDS